MRQLLKDYVQGLATKLLANALVVRSCGGSRRAWRATVLKTALPRTCSQWTALLPTQGVGWSGDEAFLRNSGGDEEERERETEKGGGHLRSFPQLRIMQLISMRHRSGGRVAPNISENGLDFWAIRYFLGLGTRVRLQPPMVHSVFMPQD